MLAGIIVIALLGLAGTVATALAIVKDGYRKVPVHQH